MHLNQHLVQQNKLFNQSVKLLNNKTMTNQFEYQSACFSGDYMMEADYDMALMMRKDCIKQLLALRELQPMMEADEFCRLRMLIRANLSNAQADIDHYDTMFPEAKIKRLESAI
jgi:hypothetical protein